MVFTLPKPTDDGLIKNKVKPHSRDKHHYLMRYIDAFSHIVHGKKFMYYIDLFCGSGIDEIEGVGLGWGSPLIAAQAPKKFSQLLLNDLDSAKIEALKQRLARYGHTQQPFVLCENASSAVEKFVDVIPRTGSLSLAFIDPYGLNWTFESLERLSVRPMDLVIFFPDLIDMNRNWSAYYKKQDWSLLDGYLGTSDWRSLLEESNPDKRIDVLTKLFESQLKKIGYNYTSPQRIKSIKGIPLYRIIFASRSEFGRDVWEDVARKDRGGQSSFPWSA